MRVFICVPYRFRRNGWRCCRWCAMLVALAVVGLFLYAIHMYHQMLCSEEESRKIIDTLCTDYDSGAAAGNLCKDLCQTREIKYKKCTNYKGGKVILFSEWQGQPIVLKTKHPDRHTYDDIQAMDGFVPSRDDFKDMIDGALKYNLGIQLPKKGRDILNSVWSEDFHLYIKNAKDHKKARTTAMQNIYYFLQQTEYLNLKFFENSGIFPKLFGTCGHFYAMEYIPPGPLLSQNSVFGSEATWRERVKLALSLLELVRNMEYDLHEPLHMCDSKGENFGIAQGYKIKAIDADMAYFDSALEGTLTGTHNCTSHGECEFFDCKALCDKQKGRCTGKRLNNNLQVMCENIFLDRLENVYHGLLKTPPADITVELHKLLRQCANPSKSTDKHVRHKADFKLMDQIQAILKKSIKAS